MFGCDVGCVFSKVCNHPDLFEPRPIISPFRMESLHFYVPSPILTAIDYDPFKVSDGFVIRMLVKHFHVPPSRTPACTSR